EEKALIDNLSMDFLAASVGWLRYTRALSESGLEFVYQVCEKTENELWTLLESVVLVDLGVVIRRIKNDLGLRGLHLGMVFSDKVRAKLPRPHRCP
ncbi:MAG: hypothetical protein V1664_00005, partial [Candidatus Uhrbacteria bacterium]